MGWYSPQSMWYPITNKKLGNKGSEPSEVLGFGKSKVVKIGCGDFHSAALNGRNII